MRKPFPTCTECHGTGSANRTFDDVPTSCRMCDGARVDIYAFDARMAGVSRQELRFADSQMVDAAWEEASLTHPHIDYCNLPDGWTDADGEAIGLARSRLTVAILEREGSPASTYARASFGFPLAPATRFPRTPWMRPHLARVA